MLDASSPLVTKQRPKTDIYPEMPSVVQTRPRTAKISGKTMTVHAKSGSVQNNKPEVELEKKSNMAANVMDDYLSLKCNTHDILTVGDGSNVTSFVSLRDDEEYYLDMDPVEYFYSPIVDIFPIATLTTRMGTSKGQNMSEKSLQSSSHFLPIVEGFGKFEEKQRKSSKSEINQSKNDNMTSRKSSFQNYTETQNIVKEPLHSNENVKRVSQQNNKVDNKEQNTGNVSLQYIRLENKEPLPPISEPRLTEKMSLTREIPSSEYHTNINKKFSYVPTRPKTEDTAAQQQSKIPIAHSYFLQGTTKRSAAGVNPLQSNFDTSTIDSKPFQNVIEKRKPSLVRRKVDSNSIGQMGVYGANFSQGVKSNAFVSGTEKLDRENSPSMRSVQTIQRTEKSYITTQITVKKTKKTFRNGAVEKDEGREYTANQNNAYKTKWASSNQNDSQKTKWASSNQNESNKGKWASSNRYSKILSFDSRSKRFQNLNSNKKEDFSLSQGNRRKLLSQQSPKVLNDSSIALTSSIRPFTEERKTIHDKDSRNSPLKVLSPLDNIHMKAERRKEELTKARPFSDKFLPNEKEGFPFPPRLKPLKVRFDKMEF